MLVLTHRQPTLGHPVQTAGPVEQGSRKNRILQRKGSACCARSNTRMGESSRLPRSPPAHKRPAFANSAKPGEMSDQPPTQLYYPIPCAFWWTRMPLSATFTDKG